jgi:hypothetical protein
VTSNSSVHEVDVAQALTKGACPVCGSLKDLQWRLAEAVPAQAGLRLCNFHVWALARSRDKLSRSTPGESVTNIFLEMLKDPLAGKVNSNECQLCLRVLEEEGARLRELALKFQSAVFAQWMKSQGTLCLDHGRKLREFVPLRFRGLIEIIVERNRAEIEDELRTFREHLGHGIHAGGGILGRAAEFLVGQRGL